MIQLNLKFEGCNDMSDRSCTKLNDILDVIKESVGQSISMIAETNMSEGGINLSFDDHDSDQNVEIAVSVQAVQVYPKVKKVTLFSSFDNKDTSAQKTDEYSPIREVLEEHKREALEKVLKEITDNNGFDYSDATQESVSEDEGVVDEESTSEPDPIPDDPEPVDDEEEDDDLPEGTEIDMTNMSTSQILKMMKRGAIRRESDDQS